MVACCCAIVVVVIIIFSRSLALDTETVPLKPSSEGKTVVYQS